MSSVEVPQTAKLQRACRIWKALAIGALAALALVVVLMTTLVLSLYHSVEDEARKARMNFEQAKAAVDGLQTEIESAEAKAKRKQRDIKRELAERAEEFYKLLNAPKPKTPGAKQP